MSEIDVLDAPAPFALDASAPLEVWVWKLDKRIYVIPESVGKDADRFVVASHDERTIRRVMEPHKRPGWPIKATVPAIERMIRNSRASTIVGWAIWDEHGEVMRRYVR